MANVNHKATKTTFASLTVTGCSLARSILSTISDVTQELQEWFKLSSLSLEEYTSETFNVYKLHARFLQGLCPFLFLQFICSQTPFKTLYF